MQGSMKVEHFFSGLFGTASQEGVEHLSRHIGMGWGNSLGSIRGALLHLDYQPRENRKGSLLGTQFHHGVALWVHSGKDFRAGISAKAPPPHYPTSSTSAWRSWPTPHSAEDPLPPAADPSHCHQKLCCWSLSLLLLLQRTLERKALLQKHSSRRKTHSQNQSG